VGGNGKPTGRGGGANVERALVNLLQGGVTGGWILDWILQKYDEVARTGFLNGKTLGSCEQRNEPTGCTKC